MNAQSAGAGAGHPSRPRWQLRRSAVLCIAGAVLAIGAFLLWGPIGLGNGPLSAEINVTQAGPDTSGGPVGFVIPLENSGHARAVVDDIDLIGGTRYAGPRLIGLETLTTGRCGGAWPTRQTARGFVLTGCGGAVSGPLIGHAFGHTRSFFYFPAAANVAAPAPGRCWVMTKIVVHYHVGIRRYSASNPYRLAVCADTGDIKAAIAAAEAAR